MPLRPDPELSPLLDEAAPAPSAAVLSRIVGRRNELARRRLWVVTGVSVTVALAAVGVTVASLTRPPPATAPLAEAARYAASAGLVPARGPAEHPAAFAGSTAPAALGPGPPAGMRWASATASQRALTPLFRRRVGGSDGATVRTFVEPAAKGVAEPLTSPQAKGSSAGAGRCRLGGGLLVEVSNDGAVGDLFVPGPVRAPGTFAVVDVAERGAAEHSPVEVVAARVSAAVARVRAIFADGHVDEMTPRQGWVALVDPLAPGGPAEVAGAGASARGGQAAPGGVGARLVASSPSGAVMASASLPAPPAVSMSAGCFSPGGSGSGAHG